MGKSTVVLKKSKRQLLRFGLILVCFFLLWFLVVCSSAYSVLFAPKLHSNGLHYLFYKYANYYAPADKNRVEPVSKRQPIPNSSCTGRYIYVHDIPSRFNTDILKNCTALLKWPESDMCQATLNMGLGPRMVNSHGILQNKAWFSTHPNMLELIFHNRMNQYKCLTNASSLASAIFVPFYAGLDLGRFLWGFNTSVRDSAPIDLLEWLVRRPEWKSKQGKDHFLVLGRTTWDFRRLSDDDSAWGNKLMYLPEVNNHASLPMNLSRLELVERTQKSY